MRVSHVTDAATERCRVVDTSVDSTAVSMRITSAVSSVDVSFIHFVH